MQRRALGDEHPDTLGSANNPAATLVRRAKYAEAEEMLQSSVLGSAHPHTLVTERWLEDVRSSMRAEQPMRTAGKAAAPRTECAAAAPLALTALAEVEASASAAEAELLAMLDLSGGARGGGRLQIGLGEEQDGGKGEGQAGSALIRDADDG